MKSEIEAKFLNCSHDQIRATLKGLGAVCEQPMRLMRRVVVHNETMSQKNAFLRIRDEGSRVTMTYKQFDDDSIDGAKEHEVAVSDFDTAIALLESVGLAHDTYQESKRENWRLGEAEIMLDEWPWLNPYIEIEAPTESAVREAVAMLDLDWQKAIFGGVANIYAVQYPHIGESGKTIINNSWPVIKFNSVAPELLLPARNK